jgi:conjugative relaxase-like TrwC/TraI family protein
MLRPYTARSAYGVKKYFETADYYSQGNETVGLWGGKLAAEFGLEGPVTRDAFGRLCDNIHPVTLEQLTPRMNDNRRVGEDFVFSLPKEVGAYIMLLPAAERDALLERIGGRVGQVMKLIEADVETRVRKDGAFENRPGDGLAWAGFLHTTARPVPGFAPDPHPHWHMFCFNATRDLVEGGRIKAADFAKIYRDRPFYEAVFYSLVAKDLADARLPIERRPDGKWGLAGLQPLGKMFSKRTGEIEDEAKRLNIAEPGRKSRLGATTRSKKDKELSPAELDGEWDAQLTPELRRAIERVRAGDISPARAVTPAEAVAFAIDHCSEKLSVIPERELARVALLRGLGNVTLEQVEAELPRQGVFTEAIDGRAMATTDKLQAEENAIVKFAAAGQGTVEPAGVAEGLSRKLANGKSLNDGQWAAVQGLLNSSNLVNLLEGPASAGKSALLAKYDEGMRLAGQEAHYFATTAKAVEVLQEDGFRDTRTVAHLLKNEKLQAAMRGSRVVVDEVSMLGHKDAVELCEIARKNDLTLTLVGDPLQHGAVARGALMRVLKDYACIKPFRLTEIMRQDKPEYRAAATLLSEGRTMEGLEAIDRLGWVREMNDEDRVSHIAADYLQAQTDLKSLPANKRILVISPTHAGAARITDAIRSSLRDAGMLAGEDRGFTRLEAVDTSVAERGQATTYRPGDVLVFHQNAKGFKKGERITVGDPADAPLSEAARFSLYRTVENAKLAEGDRIMFTGNVRTVDGRHTLKNGMVRGVAGFTPGGHIRLDDGKLIAADAGHWNHAYCVTSYGSQGKTVQRVVVDMPLSSRGAINQEQMYVSASRGKAWMRIYTDDKEELKAAVQRSSRKLAALDIQPPAPKPVKAAKPQRWHRLRKHLERLRRLAVIDRARVAWEKARPLPQKERQQERQADYGYGR